jgi:hypothetical protein
MVSTTPMRMEFNLTFVTERKGRKVASSKPRPEPIGHVPRVTRLLALAHHFDHLIAQGIVADYAEIARLAQMSRARVTQISYLRFLAPEIQETIASHPRAYKKDPISEKALRQIAQVPDWDTQQRLFSRYALTG